jgi:hypothetical protein
VVSSTSKEEKHWFVQFFFFPCVSERLWITWYIQ